MADMVTIFLSVRLFVALFFRALVDAHFLAETLEGAARLLTWVLLDEIVVINSVLLQLAPIVCIDGLTVDWRVRVGNL